MRGIALLLLFANACVAAYAYLGQIGSDPDPLHIAVKPERVRLLTSQQVAALGPGKVAQLNITCAEWGPLTEAERVQAIELLNPLQLGKTLSTQRLDIGKPYWVSVAADAGKGGLDRTLKRVQDGGVPDAEKVRLDDGNVVSAGVYRTEEIAQARMKSLEEKGIKGIKVLPREQPLPGTLVIIREPQQATVAALEAAREKFVGAPLQFASCRDRAPG